MHPDARARLDAAIARKDAERGRPLTSREKLENLERGLGYAQGTAPWWPRIASVDTHPKGEDVEQASFMGSAVPQADAQKPIP